MNYYSRYIRTLLGTGEPVTPRGLKAKCRHNLTFATNPGITYRREKDNPTIGFMEGLQFIAGVGDLDQIARVAPHADLSLFTEQSIYGPRAGEQTQWVIDELNSDRDSRRALIILSDMHEPLNTRACTTCLQYQIVNERDLMTIVTMRSSDAVYGLPYDLIQFGMMSQMIAWCTDTAATSLIVNIGNAHIYDSTAHLATKYSPWSFSLPCVSDKYSDWVKWAKAEIPLLSLSRAVAAYEFKAETGSRF